MVFIIILNSCWQEFVATLAVPITVAEVINMDKMLFTARQHPFVTAQAESMANS